MPPSSVEWIVPDQNSTELLDVLGANLDSRPEVFSSSSSSLQDGSYDKPAEDCSPNTHGDILLEHGEALAETLESVNLSRLLGRNFETAKVQVYDGGVRKLRNGIMGDISNSLIDDPKKIYAFPLDQVKKQEGICPQNFDLEHAESVSGVALGGYYLALGNSMHQAVKLYSNNIYQIDVGNFGDGMCVLQRANQDSLALNLSRLDVSEIDVVNLSVSWEEDRNDTLRAITDNDGAGFVLVVSAGNTGSKYAAGNSRYPGRYGGEDRSNMIVVGAVQSLEAAEVEMHPASSYHPDHVDIAALGCNVPTVGFLPHGSRFSDGYQSATTRMRFVNGTSFAVPQVTFTAAMIKHLSGSDTPPAATEIRQRILVSADVNGHLFEKVVDGRVLNVAKALNLYTDILETDAGRLLRGKVSVAGKSSGDIEICPDLRLPFDSLLKISQVIGGDRDGDYLVYFREAGAFETAYCFEVPSIEIELVVDDGVNWISETFKPSEFKDVVFAFR